MLVVCESEDLREPPAEANAINELDSDGLHARLQHLRHELSQRYRIDRLIGDSPAIRRVREQVRLAAEGQVRTVVVGPTGSGREYVARAIHFSPRSGDAPPLVPLSCPLLDTELLNSAIASRDRSRGTGFQPASSSREVPKAHGLEAHATRSKGTLLLLEVDQLPAPVQDELLSCLQSPGAPHTLATARRSLLKLADEGSFSRTLAFRLSTLIVELPGLAQRREDIPLLAQLFLEEHNALGGRQLSGFTTEALDELVSYPWPKNTAELVDFVRESCQKSDGPFVTPTDLPSRIRHATSAAAHPKPADDRIVLEKFLGDIEAELIRRALKRTKGNKAKAARLLGVSRQRILRRIKQLGLE